MVKLEELAEKAKKMAAEGGDTLKEFRESEDWEQLKEMAGNLGEDAAVFVRKYPLQSVLGAAALGFFLGASLGRKR
ncbi:MAG: hypothetical protein ACXVB9_00130 [Bdellovibrionota bacterium]